MHSALRLFTAVLDARWCEQRTTARGSFCVLLLPVNAAGPRKQVQHDIQSFI